MNISGGIRGGLYVFAILVCTSAYGNNPVSSRPASIDSRGEEIKSRIENLVSVVSPQYTASVESYLRTYLEKNPQKTEEMIGRSELFFPLFEEELEASGLPQDLKYLAVIESALTPQAVSPVGAAGLWQFMRATGREYGLRISHYVDERCDPVKSTRAAIRYLDNLYRQFDSWELAMAAYNSGPGRVRYAIRRSGSRDYWKLQRYLPRETRAYVPGFIAASYVLNYFDDHGLAPVSPGQELMVTDTLMVYNDLSFTTVQSITGIESEVISFLNPVFVRRYIPGSHQGYPLILPARASMIMQAYLSTDKAAFEEMVAFEGIETGVDMEYVDKMVEHMYIIRSGDNLYGLARQHDCTVDDLKRWNRLSGDMIHTGQQLRVLKMEKVLVRTAPLLPIRSDYQVPVLPALQQIRCVMPARQSENPVEPLVRGRLSPDTQAPILRQRMSLHDLGIGVVRETGPLTPGTRVR